MLEIMEIIGYLVYVVNHEVTSQDILYQNRILYSNWEEATKGAAELTTRFENPICCLRSASKTSCDKQGYITAYRLESADVIILPVCKANLEKIEH